eukprot:g5572.t1
MFLQSASAVAGNLEDWDVCHGTSFARMFSGAEVADPAVGKWNLANARDLSQMFHTAQKADPDVELWHVTKVSSLERMFEDAPLARPCVSFWDTRNVTTFASMFYAQQNLLLLPPIADGHEDEDVEDSFSFIIFGYYIFISTLVVRQKRWLV